MERWVGRGGWSLESAGVRAINLAGISELMNVIKIQPPTRWVPSAGRSVYGRGRGGEGGIGRGDIGREGKTLGGAARIAATIGRWETARRREKRSGTRRNGYEEIPPPVIPP